jgi:hypothetical protein
MFNNLKFMKKTIHSLIKKLEISGDGKASGGFGSIRGGSVMEEDLSNNTECDNKGTCGGTNSSVCTNGTDCSKSTNSTPGSCTNSKTCFM